LIAPENVPAMIVPHTRPMLPVGRQAQAVLEAFGLPAVVDLIVEGHSQKRIATTLGVSQSSLAGYLCNLRGADAALYSEALRASAEAMIDEAQRVIEAAECTTPGVMKARAVADLLIRKAGVRNRAFRDRIDAGVALVDTGSDQPAPVPVFQIVIHPQREDTGRTIEHDPDG
jgi:hypothetical protein